VVVDDVNITVYSYNVAAVLQMQLKKTNCSPTTTAVAAATTTEKSRSAVFIIHKYHDAPKPQKVASYHFKLTDAQIVFMHFC